MQISNFKFFSAFWVLANLVSASGPWMSTHIYYPNTVNGSSDALFTSSAHGLDAPKVDTINNTSWEWWYFDAVSEDQRSSVVFTFFVAPATGFPESGAPDNAILSATIALTYPGQEFSSFLSTVQATEARVVSVGNGASGTWKGSGMEFVGTPDLSNYVINVDSPSIGVKGSMSLRSVAPAHYPCDPAEADQSMVMMPGIGWTNAVPDAAAQVELDVNGTTVKFIGIGYHDQSWGVTNFNSRVGSWYWGHGRLGPYSIVWWDTLTPAGAEAVSSYVARGGKIVGVVCTATSVRPTGANSTYPPTIGDGPPEGLHIEIDLGSEGTMIVDATSTFNIVDAGGIYYRWTGTLSGGIEGQPSFTGTALWEEFALLPPS
ncbi:hypothetical protein MMC17_006553 [Xylographa soralifera]|nr:hypothetical protein [Xylographa soralifera]